MKPRRDLIPWILWPELIPFSLWRLCNARSESENERRWNQLLTMCVVNVWALITSEHRQAQQNSCIYLQLYETGWWEIIYKHHADQIVAFLPIIVWIITWVFVDGWQRVYLLHVQKIDSNCTTLISIIEGKSNRNFIIKPQSGNYCSIKSDLWIQYWWLMNEERVNSEHWKCYLGPCGVMRFGSRKW